MSRYRKITTICCAAVFALGLAACGGGGDDGLNTSQEQELQDQKKAAEEQVATLQGQINALRAQLGLDPADDLGDSISELQQQVTNLQTQVDDAAETARMEAEEAARMAAAKTGKDLFAALAGNATADTTALDNIAAPTLSSTGLPIDAAAGAGALADATDPGPVTLKAGDSAGVLGSWNGTNYAHTNTGTKVVNAAVVYTNKGPGKTVSFADRGNNLAAASAGTAPNFTEIKGYLNVATGGSVATGANFARVMADAFTHPGTQNHAVNSDTGIFTTRGTYDGAPGVYRCTGTCSSTNDDGKGSPSGLTGTWHFKPDSGANAMAHSPDTTYLYYGWWVSKDKDGKPTAASAFRGVFGDDASIEGGTTPLATNPNTLGGSATYAGHAAGKFALDYSKNKLLDGTSDGGHFTADVTLTATFSTTATGGISGTVDNFMANGESVPWSVALHRATWDTSTNGAFAPVDDTNTANVDESEGTTWSIDGASATRSGTWSGQMYDEMPGNAPNGDGSNVPTTATGTFYSEFDNVGRMVGAFGANKQ